MALEKKVPPPKPNQSSEFGSPFSQLWLATARRKGGGNCLGWGWQKFNPSVLLPTKQGEAKLPDLMARCHFSHTVGWIHLPVVRVKELAVFSSVRFTSPTLKQGEVKPTREISHSHFNLTSQLWTCNAQPNWAKSSKRLQKVPSPDTGSRAPRQLKFVLNFGLWTGLCPSLRLRMGENRT